jgi:hypothetical protein
VAVTSALDLSRLPARSLYVTERLRGPGDADVNKLVAAPNGVNADRRVRPQRNVRLSFFTVHSSSSVTAGFSFVTVSSVTLKADPAFSTLAIPLRFVAVCVS